MDTAGFWCYSKRDINEDIGDLSGRDNFCAIDSAHVVVVVVVVNMSKPKLIYMHLDIAQLMMETGMRWC